MPTAFMCGSFGTISPPDLQQEMMPCTIPQLPTTLFVISSRKVTDNGSTVYCPNHVSSRDRPHAGAYGTALACRSSPQRSSAGGSGVRGSGHREITPGG